MRYFARRVGPIESKIGKWPSSTVMLESHPGKAHALSANSQTVLSYTREKEAPLTESLFEQSDKWPSRAAGKMDVGHFSNRL
jgi:hypothetical protein